MLRVRPIQLDKRLVVHIDTDGHDAAAYALSMFRFLLPSVIVLTVTYVSASAPSTFDRYRDVSLGDTVATVVERLQLRSTDVKVLYEHPSLVQEVTWRPHRFVSGSTVAADPLGELVLTFHLDRLARIVAIYDPERMRGLTDADLLELLSDVYGLPELQATDRRPLRTPPPARHVIGHWSDEHARVLLWREEYPRLVGLTITGVSGSVGEAALQSAIVAGARLAVEAAPGQERDRRAAAAAAIMERDARIRSENKAKFKP